MYSAPREHEWRALTDEVFPFDAQPGQSAIVVNNHREDAYTADTVFRPHYTMVPDVISMLSTIVAHHCAHQSVQHAWMTLCAALSKYRPDAASATPSVTTFVSRLRADQHSCGAQTLDVWRRRIAEMTAARSVYQARDFTVDAYDIVAPVLVVYVTEGIYAYVFFEQFERVLGQSQPNRSAPLKIVGHMIVPGYDVQTQTLADSLQ